ncbi:MAG: hypothetical protein JXJ19_08990 [Elusimicrobia bacterium]|nr:hypothetical protein [Elusimicrobiota bacterium]
MNFIKNVTAIFLIILGFGYLYRPDKISRFNSWIKENIFNDRLIIIYRKRIGVLLIFIGALILYMAVRK